jgi:hypothetical protein
MTTGRAALACHQSHVHNLNDAETVVLISCSRRRESSCYPSNGAPADAATATAATDAESAI